MPLGQGSLLSAAQGQLGSVYITSTDAVTGSFGCIIALEATVIASLISGLLPSGSACMQTEAGAGTLTNVPLPAGVAILGYFTSITLTSGKVVAYRV